MPSEDVRYIWISRWADFQHYKKDANKIPAWIKDYTKQLDDDRIRGLSFHQRGVLASLRQAFSKAGASLELDRSKLSARLGATVYQRDLDALNHAGLIEFISRDVLEQRLDELYNHSRAEVEVELEEEKVLDLGVEVGENGINPLALLKKVERSFGEVG